MRNAQNVEKVRNEDNEFNENNLNTMATKNKAMEKLTKAQLMERLRKETHRANTLEKDLEKVKEEYNGIATSKAELVEALERVKEKREEFMREAGRAKSALIDLKREHSATMELRDKFHQNLQNELADITRERDRYLQEFRKEEKAKQKVERLLVQQAHVAGALARMSSTGMFL